MTPRQHVHVEVQRADDDSGWAVVVEGQQAVVVPNQTDATQIAEELAGWLRRESRVSRA